MKILLLHNRYQIAGGEDGVVQAERNLLTQNGHEVNLLEVSNDDIKNSWDKLTTAFSAVYSFKSKDIISQRIKQFQPEIVHVHNFFPLLSPSIYDACLEHNLPVVQTLHNYRLVCPKAMPFREGKICEDCFNQPIPWPSIVHGCYRNSRLQSSVVALMNSWHKFQGTWQEKIDAYIVFTQFQKDKMIQAGLPAAKIYIKPNFVFTPENLKKTNNKNEYILFVGRLSTEKGVSLLIDAYLQANLSTPLKIVGDGPLSANLKQQVTDNNATDLIEFLGFQDKSTVLELMYNAKFLVFPSIWYEGFPLTVAEAFACGLPVIAPQLGGLPEIIEDGVTGLNFIPGNADDLAAKMKYAIAHPQAMIDMSNKARLVYENKYTPIANYHQLMAIYQAIVNDKNKLVKKL
ncbi:MAG TPA: glycosyltransferase family 4 protein [Nostocaceae cyanobacterium]|nr:glycosyltransferase family 4 protein [Nostocaceae cyanobacterium]